MTNGTYTVLANRQKDTFVHGFLDVSGSALITGNLVVGSGGNVVMTPSFGATITPNTTAATSNSWTKDGISWTASMSSIFENNVIYWNAYKAFDTTATESTKAHVTGSCYSNGAYTGSVSTTNVTGGDVTSITGEWIQISSSVSLQMTKFKFTTGGYYSGTYNQSTKSWYMLGSNDGTNWKAIQKATNSNSTGLTSAFQETNEFTTTNDIGSTISNVNYLPSSNNTLSPNNTLTITNYSGASSNYKYFRFVTTAVFSIGESLEMPEWTPTFTVPNDTLRLSSNKTTNNMVLNVDGKVGIGTNNPVYTLDVSGSALITGNLVVGSGGNIVMTSSFSSTTVTPNTTAATTDSWTKDNISWTASMSSKSTGYTAFKAFDTTATETTKAHFAGYCYSNNGGTNGTTAITSNVTGGDVTSITGEWIQISSSASLKMTKFKFRTGGFVSNTKYNQSTKSWYMLGSNDGTNWKAIQKATNSNSTGLTSAFQETNEFTTTNDIGSTISNVNYLPSMNNTLTITNYSGASSNYKYFRFVTTAVFSPGESLEMPEWTPTFTVQNDTLTLSSNKTTNNMVLNVDGLLAGTITPSLYTSGQVIKTLFYSDSNGDSLAVTTATSMTTIFTFNYTPVSSDSWIHVTFDVEFVKIVAYGTDNYAGQVIVKRDTVETTIAKKRVRFFNVSGFAGTLDNTATSQLMRQGTHAFPLIGTFKNTSTSQITINVQFGVDESGDDAFTIENPFSCMIQEVKR